MTTRRTLAGCLGIGLAVLSSSGTRAAQERPTYQATTTAVLVDVVVRDKHGRPITDLKAEDFELREDGVLQELGSFTRVSRGGGIGVRVGLREPGTTTFVEHGRVEGDSPASAPAPAPAPAVTALVFDALSSDAVSLCQRAALEYVPRSGLFETRVGVYTTEPSVRLLQGYTDDPSLIRQGVLRILPTGTTLKKVQEERLARLRDRRDSLDATGEPGVQAGAGGAALTGGAASAIGQTEVQKKLVQSEIRMIQAFDTLDREQRGYGTTGALSVVLQSLAEMPGRKTLVFFSEGLPASPALQAHLQSLVEAANRINVTIYAVDASGLRAVSGTHDARIEVEEAGKERLRQAGSSVDPTDQPVMRIIERTEDLLRFDSQGGLSRLAEGTGGFLFRDTNNLRNAFTRIDEDMRFHYLLTYTPAKQVFDGGFRSIGVKVKRPGADVFARKGYRALRTPPPPPVLDYETQALAALDAPGLARGFPFSSAAFSFPEKARPGLAPVLVRVSTDSLTYREDPQQRVYAADASIVARIKDQAGRVVQKVSQHYELNGKLEELPAARKGEILFFRATELPPGLYSVETVVVDGVGDRASVRVSTLEVPPALNETRVSSVVVVRRSERVPAAEQDAANPLYVGDRLLYPNAGEALSRSADRELTFYYTVYPRSPARAPGATVELLRSGRTLARVAVTLAPADRNGRIQQVSRLPLQPLPDGTYELRISVQDGPEATVRSTFFTVKA